MVTNRSPQCASTKANCVTTLKAVSLGTASPVSAFLEVQGSARTTDSGSFTYYAGPGTKTAGSTCVRWGGSVGTNAWGTASGHGGNGGYYSAQTQTQANITPLYEGASNPGAAVKGGRGWPGAKRIATISCCCSTMISCAMRRSCSSWP